jgi:hypothetical protein
MDPENENLKPAGARVKITGSETSA